MQAPDRIWLHPITDDEFQDVWFADGEDGDVEYVRAGRTGRAEIDDLIYRLQRTSFSGSVQETLNDWNGDRKEAATALVEAQAEIARLRALLAEAVDDLREPIETKVRAVLSSTPPE